jgi:SPP1 family predicted phage head-tail adaptor
MDRSNVIKLISSTKTQDNNGVWRETLTERQVFCNVSSVTASEFFEGGRNGLNPEYRMTMFNGDYQGETMLKFNGRTYAIYRTYLDRNDNLELYVERKGGTNGKGDSGEP